MALDRVMLKRLRVLLNDKISLSEIESVCFDLGVEYEDLKGNSKPDKLRELMLHIDKREYLFPQLLAVLHENRPDIDLTPFGGAAPVIGTGGGAAAVDRTVEERERVEEPAAPRDEYENFDIFVEHLVDNRYLVRASCYYPGPQPISASETRELDIAGEEIKELITFLEHLAAEKEDAKSFGQMLYDFLFPRSIHTLFTTLRNGLRAEERGVRIRLQIKPPALSRLPWEYCFDADKNEFLAKNRMTPVVRYFDQSFQPAELGTKGQLRLLHVISGPPNKPPLDSDREAALIVEALQPVADRVERDVLLDPDAWELQKRLNSFKPHVVHFTGHGEFEGGRGTLLLVDKNGETPRSLPLEAEQLSDLLRSSGVKIVILNACESAAAAADAPAFMSVAQGLVLAEIPAVIAMQYKMPDYLALRCTEALYTALAGGMPLDRAVADMRIAASSGTRAQDQVLWGVPVLFMVAPDGRVWQGSFSPAPVPVGAPAADPASPSPAAAEKTFPLDAKLQELEKVLVLFVGQLGGADGEDLTANLADAHESLRREPPQGRRAARKLGNIVDILSDANVGTMIVPGLQQLIAEIEAL